MYKHLKISGTSCNVRNKNNAKIESQPISQSHLSTKFLFQWHISYDLDGLFWLNLYSWQEFRNSLKLLHIQVILTFSPSNVSVLISRYTMQLTTASMHNFQLLLLLFVTLYAIAFLLVTDVVVKAFQMHYPNASAEYTWLHQKGFPYKINNCIPTNPNCCWTVLIQRHLWKSREYLLQIKVWIKA